MSLGSLLLLSRNPNQWGSHSPVLYFHLTTSSVCDDVSFSFFNFCFFCIIFTCLLVFLFFPYTHRLASCPFFLFFSLFFAFLSFFFFFSFFLFSFFFFWNLGSRPGTPFRSFYCFLFRGNNFILPTPLVWSRNNVGVWRSFFWMSALFL